MVTTPEYYVDRYIKQHHKTINRVCEPLTTCFNINYFTYHSIENSGACRALVSRPDWADYYVENQLYRIDPCMHHPQNYQSGTLFWAHHLQEDVCKETMDVLNHQFDMAHAFFLIERSPERCEFFGFAAPVRHEKIYSTYMQELPLLKKFCAFFKSEMSSVLESMESDPMSLLELKGDSFTSKVSLFTQTQSAHTSFLQLIQADPGISLSRREKECLSLYLDEMQMKEVANKLDLSVRTIEFYLNNIKSKLDCSSKSELIKKGQELRSLGLIL